MKALVTGGAGFIGSHLVDRLLQENYQVYVIDNLSTGSNENLNEGAELFIEDICNYSGIEKVFSAVQPEIVFHLAAHIDVAASFENPEFDFNVNVSGTLNVLQAAVQAGTKKIVFASSAAVYGEPLYLPVDEDHPLKPLSPYGVSKASAEWYLQTLARKSGLQTVILRLSNVYGPRQGLKKSSGLISILTKSFFEGKEVTLFAPKMMTRDYIYVEDVVEAICLSAEKIDEGVFNISSCTETSNLEVYQLVSKEIPGTYNVGPYREGEVKRIFLDNSRAKRIMGWEPKTSLEAGIKKTVSFYREWLKR